VKSPLDDLLPNASSSSVRIRRLDLGDSATPPEQLFSALGRNPHTNLLLSGGVHPLSRFSFIGLDPFLVLTAKGRKLSVVRLPDGRRREFDGDPFECLRAVLDRFRFRRPWEGPDHPPFIAGGIGYLAYELGRQLEKLPATALDDLGLPEMYFAFYRALLCHDRTTNAYTLYWVDPAHSDSAADAGGSLETLGGRLRDLLGSSAPPPGSFRPNSLSPVFHSNFTRADYLEAIRCALEYIRAGDIYQVNLSQRFRTSYDGDPWGLFLRLYEINPAPFFAYLDPGPFQVLSSSPERFLFVQGDRVETRPIKGTLPRGPTPEADAELGRELLASEKNRAELAMITDLLRNDLGRVCAFGSVVVEEQARLEAYTNVFHLVSVVSGRLAPGRDRIDLLRATFPGGSITGCPKIRAMEIIDELEPTVRSVYTGSIGYLGFDGSMDLNIAIRTLIRKGADLFYQAGGGIVFDSVPDLEYEETLHKAASIRKAILDTSLAIGPENSVL